MGASRWTSSQHERIRNVVLVGHSGAGKTTLVEALLHRAGVTTRIGRVEDGTTVTGTDPEEVKRGMSLSLGIAPFDWKASDGETYKINLLDAPGYSDFVGEELAGAQRGRPRHPGRQRRRRHRGRHRAGMGAVRRREHPAARCSSTRTTSQRANFHNVLAALQAKWGHGFVPLELPLGEEESLHGIADVLSDQAFEYDRDGQHHTVSLCLPTSPTKSTACTTSSSRRSCPVTTTNSSATSRATFRATAELERTLAHEVLDCLEFPVLVGSALTGVGIDRLADFICEIGPAPC